MTKVFNLKELSSFSNKKGKLTIPNDLADIKNDLLETKNFTIATVCLDSEQEIPLHPEPYGACFYVIHGKGIFTVGEEQFELSEGQMIFAPANETRAIKCVERLMMIGIHDPH